MYSKLSMLSSAEQECIHEKSLELLEKIGVVIASEKTRQLLQKKGARPVWESAFAETR